MQEEFSRLLRVARKKAGYTQKSLAEELKVATGTVQQWELGTRFPRIGMLKKIEETLQISLIKPLSGKTETVEIGSQKYSIVKSSGAIELDAFNKFMDDIGFSTYIDFSRFENPSGKNGDVWIIEDRRTNETYTATTNDLDTLKDTVLSYSKFQIYEMLRNLPKIQRKEIGNYKCQDHTEPPKGETTINSTDAVSYSPPDDKKPSEGQETPSDGNK